VALARLLVTHCDLWVLDEPLTALDVRGRAAVEELLIEHARAGGMVVFTTHHGLPLHGYGVKSLDLDARR
jgi:heme exporter protein A